MISLKEKLSAVSSQLSALKASFLSFRYQLSRTDPALADG
jgi:hypothetical protein